MEGLDTMIYFRQVNEPHKVKGVFWHVECYEETEGTVFPVGTFYVVALPNRPEHAQVGYILVGDKWRRRGIARKLHEACKEKWPELQYTSAMGSEGEGFLRSVTDHFEQLDEGD